MKDKERTKEMAGLLFTLNVDIRRSGASRDW